jgi:hypothetical protein
MHRAIDARTGQQTRARVYCLVLQFPFTFVEITRRRTETPAARLPDCT